MKKLVTVLLIGVLSVSFVFAGGGGQSNAGKTNLTLYTWWGGGEAAFGEALVADFEASHPNIKVERSFGGTDYDAKINTMIAAGNTPDVFQVNEDRVVDWGEKGVGADLNPFFAQMGIKPEDYYLDNYRFTSGGHLWGIATNPTVLVLWYNRDLFRQAGVAEPPASAANPWTWDQYVAAAKKLTKDSNGRTPNDAGFNYDAVTQWGTVMPTGNYVYWMPLLYSAGTSVANENGTALALNSPAGAKVFQAMYNLSTVDKAAPSYAVTISNTFSNQSAMLMNGQIAMYIGGGWQLADFLNEDFDVGITSVPTFSNKGVNMTWGAGFMMKKSGSQESFQLYEFMVNYTNWINASKNRKVTIPGAIATTRGAYNDSSLNATWLQLLNPNAIKVYGDIVQNAARLGENVTLKNFPEIMGQIINPGLQKVWMGEETVDQSLRAINGQLNGKFQGAWK
ncbi:sugar ABC transporter substrate-binding protein [Spirochaetia bacterium]|nr:sugar ABC transporter substrate-binding protein [Spirochaetia bacterium]